MCKNKTIISLTVGPLFAPPPSYAIDFVDSFITAQNADPAYHAANADKKATPLRLIVERLSYLPNHDYTHQQLLTPNIQNMANAATSRSSIRTLLLRIAPLTLRSRQQNRYFKVKE
jgi:hypothetical protein